MVDVNNLLSNSANSGMAESAIWKDDCRKTYYRQSKDQINNQMPSMGQFNFLSFLLEYMPSPDA